MNKTYHDFLEAAYFGRYRERVPRSKVMKPGLHYRNDPNSMANLTAKPSYHFGPIIDVLPLLNVDWPPSRENHADSAEASELFSKVNDHLDRLGHDNVALVFDGDESSNTIIIMTHFEFIYSNFTVAIHFPDGWLMLDGQHLTENAVCYLRVVERALRLLAHPSHRPPTSCLHDHCDGHLAHAEEGSGKPSGERLRVSYLVVEADFSASKAVPRRLARRESMTTE